VKDRLIICVAGWHFNEAFYRQVTGLGGDVFVISHRARRDIPDYVPGLVGRERVCCEPNFGYDWGCYQQFLRRGLWRDYDYAMFIHDDVEIRSPDLFPRCIERLTAHAVVGNGRVDQRCAYPDITPQSYAHGMWKPPSRRFTHDVVRGSFFATTRQALGRLGTFEVHWDSLRLYSNLGNWSTRASCGRWESLLGETCFGFLSDAYRDSEFLLELERGGAGEAGKQIRSKTKRGILDWLTRKSYALMQHYWQEDSTYYRVRPVVVWNLSLIVWALSRNRGAWSTR
jgi:hypothetical protein